MHLQIETMTWGVQASGPFVSSRPSFKAEELLAALVARTHELPADRCVLDPDGEGGAERWGCWSRWITGNFSHSYLKLPFIVDLPIKIGDVPYLC